eukprot:195665-Rhodomonas_salina.1
MGGGQPAAKPVQPAAGGLSFGGGFGSSAPAPAFGSAPAFGTSAPAFGSSTTPGFGSAAAAGSFGSPAPAKSGFGSVPSFGPGVGGFGSPAPAGSAPGA